MKYFQNKSAFSLVELVIVVTIIAIIWLWVSRFDFSRLTQQQQSKIEMIRIKALFEEVRNNALLWKAVTSLNIIPSSWKVDVSLFGSGRVLSHYLSGSTWINTGKSWSASRPFRISSILCKNLSQTLSGSLTGTGTLLITWSLMSISGSWCTDPNFKILEIVQSDGRFSETLYINTVTGTIEIR
jgi:prepilin-type N-terminal cleavage/methylation domain-containing protein